jgi:sulfate transport system substrate-binding protein
MKTGEFTMNKTIPMISRENWGHPLNWLIGSILTSLIIYCVWSGLCSPKTEPIRLVVYAFSTQEEALTQGIFPAFEQSWEAENGRELKVEGVFGPSGVLAGEINLGAPAHVALFSNLRHVNWLKLGKRLRPDAEPVIYASTSLVIVTRPGNPAGFSDFSDLAQPGLQLLHADPRSSGVGEWAVLAEYGSAYLENGDQDAAKTQLKDIWKNVRLLGDSARATLTLFELGVGDALVTYEQDALLAQESGAPIEIITPKRTILPRHFAVIIDDNITASEQLAAEAFLDFLLSNDGQQILSKYHLRPVVFENDAIAQGQKTFTEEDLGGWAWAYDALIKNLWEREIAPNLKLESASTLLGVGE